MSWAEFRIRLFALKRMQEREEMLFREVSYSAYVSGWMGMNKPPSKEKFWPIGNVKKTGVSDQAKQAFLKAREQYLKEKKEKGG